MSLEREYFRHWDEKFSTRAWGRYPPEDLVRFMGRTYTACRPSEVSVLEIGCGPGANLWFLQREGYKIAGIDSSEVAIEKAINRIASEGSSHNLSTPDLKVGNFSELPWPDASFDLVIDIFALYANTLDVIKLTLKEVDRVLKPGARFYSKLWGRNTTGFGQGREIEAGTYDNISIGPCCEMGVSHFFDRNEVLQIFSMFEIIVIDVITRTDQQKGYVIEEFACQFQKAF